MRNGSQRGTQDIVYFVMVAIIGLITSYDIYLTVKYTSSLFYLEQNSFARTLLVFEKSRDVVHSISVDASRLVLAKVVGVLFATKYFMIVYHKHKKLAWLTIIPIFFLQCFLLIYLTF